MSPFFLLPISLLLLIMNENFSVTSKLSKTVNLGLIVLFSLFATFRVSSLADYGAYEAFFRGSEIGERFEPSAKIIRALSPNVYVFFFIYAFVGVSLKLIAIRKIANYQLLSIITYLSTSFALHDMIQIRASCAIAVFWMSLRYLQARKYFSYFALILCACLFHVSAAVFFILPCFSSPKISKTIWIGLVFISYLVALSHFDFRFLLWNFSQDVYMVATVLGHKDALNIFNTTQLLRMIVFLLLLFNPRLNETLIPLLKVLGFSIIILPLLSSLSLLAYRISEMLSTVIVFLLPEVVKCFKNRQNGYMCFIMICFLFCGLNNIYFFLVH